MTDSENQRQRHLAERSGHESEKWSENATLIAASREAMPALLDAIDAKDALIAELIALIEAEDLRRWQLEILSQLKARAAQ